MNKKIITCYETDASRLIGKAEKVAFPKKIEEVQELIKKTKLDIVPRGAGTGLVGGCIPDNSLVLDMGKMNNISGFNPVKKTIRVEAGATLKELNEKLNAAGFEFPIASFNYGISTIGGMIARNASGDLKYEAIKQLIEEIEFVNGRGELMKTSKADLMDICSMEGITGIIVAATLRIIPNVKKSASIFQTENLDEALSIARRLKLEKEVVMLELFPPNVSRLLGFKEKYNIIIEFDSDRGKIKGDKYELVSKLKDQVYSILYSKEYYNSEDYKFFFDKLKDFILFLESHQILYFGFLGSGIIRPFFRDNEKDKKNEVIKLIKRIKAKQGGYGIGLNRKYLLDSFETKVTKRVKLRYDPFGKLNMGKIVDAEVTLRKYASKQESQHLEPIRKEEIEEIKSLIEEKSEEIQPSLGEEISAFRFKEEMESPGEMKTPEQEMSEFIKEAEILEIKKEEPNRMETKVSLISHPSLDEEPRGVTEGAESIANEEEKVLKDYEQTYESELPEERRKKIEDFAQGVPKRASEKVELRGKLTKEEQDAINKVMMGGFGLNSNKDKNEEEEN